MKGPHYHLAGIGGVGMSALAQALLATGADVSGSDRFLDQGRSLGVLKKLESAGVLLTPQDGSGLRPSTAALVFSTAIEPDNPDRLAAQRLRRPLVHRAEMLARLVAGKTCVAVTGTAGKTTVTGMIGWLLQGIGWDPNVVNGGAVLNWMTGSAIGNVRVGASDLWVMEADESDRSLLNFSPDWAVITNMSKDHFELEEVRNLFRAFAARVKKGIVCGPGVTECLRDAGLPSALQLVSAEEEIVKRGMYFGFSRAGIDFEVPLPGRHNALNACAAVALCEQLGAKVAELPAKVRSFQGIERRLELVGVAGGIAVIDDYAHNPEKIRAAWTAVSSSHPRILGIWRPHGYGPLASMQSELAGAFAAVCRPADRLYILPVYYAGGTAQKTVTSESFVKNLQGKGVSAHFASDYPDIENEMIRHAREGDAVLGMGARDPDLPLFARQLVAKLSRRLR